MCQFFKVSRSGYYGYVSRMDMPAKDLPLAEKIEEFQDRCGMTYGYRRECFHSIYTNLNTLFKNFQKVLLCYPFCFSKSYR